MVSQYKSEIRDSDIRDLLQKVKEQKYGIYLHSVLLNKVRAFENQIVNFDFPVTAIIGTNGGGKSTILGATALAHKLIRPGLFFPKSSIGDNSMSNWSIGYEMTDKRSEIKHPRKWSARFKYSKWVRDDLADRTVLYFGITRTVPAGERKEFKKLASGSYKFSGVRSNLHATVQSQVEKILGKDVSKFEMATISSAQSFYVGGDGKISYSEFHFGAGESSVLRMVALIEDAPTNALVLIEEIENGLHPVAVRRMVEYLIDVASRKSIQTIFTSHSEDALLPLPPEAIWSSIDGKVRQGRISIEALRAITGRIDQKMAVFVEDDFSKGWVEAILRNDLEDRMDEIGVYFASGDGRAHIIHRGHRMNPVVKDRVRSVCVVDGDSSVPEDLAGGVIKLPGRVPESEVFNYVRNNLDNLSMKLAVALHVPSEREARVKAQVEEVSRLNRDPHLLFNQVGQSLNLIPESIVRSAFIGLWLANNTTEAARISDYIRSQFTQ